MSNHKQGTSAIGAGQGGFRMPPGEAIEQQEMPADFDEAFDRAFPAPEPRQFQKEVVKEALKAYIVDDKDVVMLDAPPGFGKSVTIYTILRMLAGDAYYCTPLKSLQEQLIQDGLIGGEMVEIMGRNNYPCILPDAGENVTVENAKCQREDNWECDIKSQCPYYSQKDASIASEISLMNLAYMMNVPMTPEVDDGTFCPRDTMVIDECQGLDDWAMTQIGVTVNRHQVPDEVWASVEKPPESMREDYDRMVKWLRTEVLPAAKSHREYIQATSMTKEEVDDATSLDNFISKIKNFLDDHEDHHWALTYNYDINKNSKNVATWEFKPIKVGRFLEDLVWSNCDKILLSSATIPKGNWLNEVGLEDADVRRLSLPSTFPVENRPIVTSEAVGKMTYDEKDETMGKMVNKIKAIAEHHSGEKGIVHCRGYNYISLFKHHCKKEGILGWFKDNVHTQDKMDREGSLEEWINNDKQVFLSVNMAEGIDLKGDKCRWQVLMKAEYPHLKDERVNYRLNEMGDQDWYNQQAVIQIEQAYGRAVRSDEDEAVFYILDDSAVNLISYNERLFHDWFLEAIQ